MLTQEACSSASGIEGSKEVTATRSNKFGIGAFDDEARPTLTVYYTAIKIDLKKI